MKKGIFFFLSNCSIYNPYWQNGITSKIHHSSTPCKLIGNLLFYLIHSPLPLLIMESTMLTFIISLYSNFWVGSLCAARVAHRLFFFQGKLANHTNTHQNVLSYIHNNFSEQNQKINTTTEHRTLVCTGPNGSQSVFLELIFNFLGNSLKSFISTWFEYQTQTQSSYFLK